MSETLHEASPETVFQMPPPARLLMHLFRFLDREGVGYVVAGDPAGLPAHTEGDVDLIVEAAIMPRFTQLLIRFGIRHGAQLVQAIAHEQTACFYVLAFRDESGRLYLLQVDVCSDYYRSGKRLLSADFLLQDRRRVADPGAETMVYWVPAPAPAFLYYLIKKVDKGHLTAAHGAYLTTQWNADAEPARAALRQCWTNDAHRQILSEAALTGVWDTVQAHLPVFQNDLHQTVKLSVQAQWGEVRRTFKRMLRPTGCWVAFFGPDGSGKSSVIGQVQAHLGPVFWRTETVHLRPSLGQPLNDGTAAPVTDPHGLPARSALGSVAKLLYYVFDYVAGYLLRIRPLLMRTTLVCFDRYYHDLLVDPARFRYGGPRGLLRLMAGAIPKPDLFVILDAPAEVMQQRKQEVPLQETRRQRAAYRDLAAGLPNAFLVDAAQDLPGVVDQVNILILNHLARRFA